MGSLNEECLPFEVNLLAVNSETEVNSSPMSPRSPEDVVADQLKIPPWGQVLIKWTISGAVFYMVLIGGLYAYLFSMKGDLGKLQGQMDHLPVTISQQLIERSQQYVSAGEKDKAARALRLANEFIATANDEKLQADKVYFKQASAVLGNLATISDLKAEAFTAVTQLATYRSSLEKAPQIDQAKKQDVVASQLVSKSEPNISPSSFQGRSVLIAGKPLSEMVDFGIVHKLSNNFRIANLVLFGGVPGVSQTLDGAHWIEVTFVNIHIRYEGGEVELNHVSFINCTFEIVNDDRGIQFADYVSVRANPYLIFPQESKSSWVPRIFPVKPDAIAGVVFREE
jgi:hypothetical protein